ncbi:porin [Caballeronia sp. SEWSISQ10-4 2]|uniref:porin n=1 Tax=Caballeronia sp. SEWSISQ10-4 2 TaxID=2937438 RepID=UPI00265696AA|nr:porin [Caballeronia sp. SEWSISQ10-4 2]MDN7179155.1 porin [Caballeronia sp. SEWSISQ10-4 2]
MSTKTCLGRISFACLMIVTAHQAYAQSSVQLYGVVGAYIDSAKRSGGPNAVLQEGSGGLTTSYFGLRGREDLGDGYAAIFGLESFFQPATGAQGRNATDPFFSRNAWLGVDSKYGRLMFGRQTNPTYSNMAALNPFGSSVVFSPLVLQTFVANYGSTIIGDTVWNNAIQYASPSVYGFTTQAVYGVGGVAGQNGIANIGLHAQYSNGGLSAALSAQRVRTPVTAPLSEQYAYLGGVSYDLGFVKLFAAGVATNSHGTNVNAHTYELGATVPLSPFAAILIEGARTRSNAPRGVSTIRNTASVAYDYFLSKGTDIYAVYSYDKINGRGSASTEGFGMRHSF